jgi:hypothetical protein
MVRQLHVIFHFESVTPASLQNRLNASTIGVTRQHLTWALAVPSLFHGDPIVAELRLHTTAGFVTCTPSIGGEASHEADELSFLSPSHLWAPPSPSNSLPARRTADIRRRRHQGQRRR